MANNLKTFSDHLKLNCLNLDSKNYTDLDEKDFRSRLSQIQPWLQEPLQFERMLFAHLSQGHRPIEEFPQYNRLHRFLNRLWTILDETGTYEHMTPPLELG
mgnify:CR=1 FL=1